MTEEYGYGVGNLGFELNFYGDRQEIKRKEPEKSVYQYPLKPTEYQTLFIKMNSFSQRKRFRSPDSTIYLPLPLGLLRTGLAATYQFREFNIAGEAGKAIGQLMNESGLFAPVKEIGGLSLQALSNSGKALNTLIEQNIQSTTQEQFNQIRAGAGYAQRGNYTKYFQHIDRLREFRADWELKPKTIQDARAIEQIIKEIQKASLPEISDVSFFEEIAVNSPFVERSKDYVLGGDSTENGDVVEKAITHDKLYSSTFRIPKEFELSIYEYVGERQFEPIQHLVNFPTPFVIENMNFQIGGEDSEADTFIEHVNENGVKEYFNSSFRISLGFRELKQFTADNIEPLRTNVNT